MENVKVENGVEKNNTMNYKLAKELKEAGFLQSTGSILDLFRDIDGSQVHVPTLSELIEACGGWQLGGYFGLSVVQGNPGGWVA